MQAAARTARGELTAAAALHDQARRVAVEHGDLEVASWGHIWEARLAYATGRPGEAVALCEHGLTLAERIGSSFSLVVAWFHLGHALLRAGRPADAIAALERSTDIAGQTGLVVHLGWREALLAEAHLAAGDPARAQILANAAAATTRAHGQVIESIDADLAVARVAHALGETEKGQASLASATATVRATGAHMYTPLIAVEHAALARSPHARRTHLLDAEHGFATINADGHLEAIRRTLASST
jgi:tetratricopeptide (TPR) repeat protein